MINKFIKKRKTELLCILIILVPALIFYANIIGSYQQLPSPLYGGDYYFHYGITQHIYNGNAPWTDPQIQGEYNFYGWFYHSSVAYLSKITGIELFTVFIYFPLLALILNSIIAFYLGKRLFKKDLWALLFGIIWVGLITNYHALHGRGLVSGTLIPLFFLLFLKLEEKPNLKIKILLGVILGLLGLTHLMAFASVAFFVIIYALYGVLQDQKHFLQKIKEAILKYWLIALIGTMISMAYIGPLLFYYKLQTLNNQPVYSAPIVGFMIFFNYMKSLFFNYSNVFLLILSFIALIGLAFVIIKRKQEVNKIILSAFISVLIGGFNFFLTKPFGYVMPGYFRMTTFITPLLKAIFICFGVVVIYNSIKNEKIKKVALFVFIALLFGAIITAKYALVQNKWVQVGKTDNSVMFDMGDWVKENTPKNAVFLSTNEGSFALFSLTGRKLVVNRGTHTSQFIDLDKRTADAAIILYGNSDKAIKMLVKKYNISYVYYDETWVNNIKWDPFLVSPDNAEMLDKFNVTYEHVNKRLDPGKTNVPSYDLLEIKSNMIWSEKFNSYLYPVKGWDTNQQPKVVIFGINKTKINEK